jgi:hypothetical protein
MGTSSSGTVFWTVVRKHDHGRYRHDWHGNGWHGRYGWHDGWPERQQRFEHEQRV